MAVIDLSIDLGSKFITIFQKGIGLVLKEPSIAIVTREKNKTVIKDAGYRAESILSGSLCGARLVAPIHEGIVVDEEMASLLLGYFIDKITPDKLIKPKIRAIVSIASSSSISDRKAAENACLKAGIKEVTLVEGPLSLLAYTNSIGGLFLDIGGGKTEIASVTNHGIASGCTVNIGGDAFNGAIIDSVFKHYGVKAGEYTIEELKKSALSFFINDVGSYAISGGSQDGTPRSLFLSCEEMRNAVLPLVDDIIEVVISVLNQTPPELAAEVLRKGIFLSGGSTAIPGIVDYIKNALELPVTVLNDPVDAVAIGGSKFFNNKNLLSDMLGVKLS
ncbi:MAG: rod shape-determining protein [Clostridia bacterium]|nr:rod shape-determining protein [Clostridia bacterium]